METRMTIFVIFVIVMFIGHIADCYTKWYDDVWEPYFSKAVQTSCFRLAFICIVYFIFM